MPRYPIRVRRRPPRRGSYRSIFAVGGAIVEAVPVSQTFSKPYEALRTLSATTALPFEAVKLNTSSYIQPWEALKGISTAAFGQTSVLDDFNRADGDLGANWSMIHAGVQDFNIVSNTAMIDTGPSGTDAWIGSTFSADQEVFVTIAAISNGGRIYARINQLNSTTYTGYRVSLTTTQLVLDRLDSGSGTIANLGSYSFVHSVGDKLGLRCIGSSIQVWVHTAGAWSNVLTVTDATYAPASSYIGIGVNSDTTVAFDDFGGGNVTVPQMSYESLTGLSSTKINPYEAIGQASNTYIQPWEALQRITTVPPFGSTGVLDTFTGSDETPIATNWTAPIFAGDNSVRRISNAAVAAVAGGWSGAYYDLNTYGPNVEAYATITTLGSSNLVWARVQDAGTGTPDAYLAKWLSGNAIQLQRVINGSATVIGSGTVVHSSGDGLGIRCVGSSIQLWTRQSGVWTLQIEVTDTTITSAGHIGIEMNGTTPIMDDFGGGNITVPQMSYETLQGLSSTTITPYEALGRASNTYIQPWEALVGRSATYLKPYEALKRISTTAFAQTPILDEFTGTGALSGSWSPNIINGYAAWERDTDVAKATGFRSSYWNTTFGEDQEVFATIVAIPTIGDCRLHCRIQNPGATYSSYHVTFHNSNTFLDKTVAGTRTTLKTYGAGGLFSAGDQIGLRVIGNQIQIYKNGSPLAGDPPYTDSSVTGPGYIGMWSQNDTVVRLDNFGGGNATVPVMQYEALGSLSSTYLKPYESIGFISQLIASPYEAIQKQAYTYVKPYEALFALSSGLKINPYESLVGLTGTTIVPYEAMSTSALAVQYILAWEAMQGISNLIANPYDALGSLSHTIANPYEANKNYSFTYLKPYEALFRLAQTAINPYEAVQSIAQTQINPYEVLQGITSGAEILPYEATQGISSLFSNPYDALGFLTFTYLKSWEALQGIRSILSPVAYESLLGITGSTILPWEAMATAQQVNALYELWWEAIGWVTTTVVNPYEAIGKIAALSITPYEALLGLRALQIEPYESTQSLVVPSTSPYEALFKFTTTSTEPYEALQGISATGIEPYEALLGLSGLTTNPYDALGSLSSTTTNPYDALGTTISPTTTWWEALQTLRVIEPVVPYETLRGISGTTITPYEAMLGLSTTATNPWESLIPANAVNAQYDLWWEALGWITATHSNPYEALIAITSGAKITPYEALAGLSKLHANPYDALGSLSGSTTVPYEALQGIRSLSILSWEAVFSLSSLLGLPYESIYYVVSSSATPYEALQKFSTLTGIPYESLLGITTTIPYPWEAEQALGSVNAQFTIPWEAIGWLLVQAPLPYESVKRIAITASNPYEALAGATRLSDLWWEARGSLSLQPILPYESISRVTTNYITPYEVLRQFAQLTQIPFEALGTLSLTGQFPWEAFGALIEEHYLKGTLHPHLYGELRRHIEGRIITHVAMQPRRFR